MIKFSASTIVISQSSLGNKVILKIAVTVYGDLIFFSYVVYFYSQDTFFLIKKLINSPKASISPWIINIE